MDVRLHEATVDDLELMMAWRSHPRVYAGFYEQDQPLTWEEHLSWWRNRQDRIDWLVTLDAGDRPRDVGSVNVSRLNTEVPEVGIYIGELSLWGSGIGEVALEACLSEVRDRGYDTVRARILDDNDKSSALFEKVGFERVGDARNGEHEYRLSL